MISLKEKQLHFLQEDIQIMDISQKLQNSSLKLKIHELEKCFQKEVCSDIPFAFFGT